MPLPRLLEEDLRQIDAALDKLLRQSEASMAVLIDKAGFLISQVGEGNHIDTTTLAALAAGSFAATQGIASLTNETNFNSVYQQGDHFSLLIQNVDAECLLVVVFKASLSAGAVKYYALSTIAEVAGQMKAARERDPTQVVDLAALDIADTSTFFHRKKADAH